MRIRTPSVIIIALLKIMIISYAYSWENVVNSSKQFFLAFMVSSIAKTNKLIIWI